MKSEVGKRSLASFRKNPLPRGEADERSESGEGKLSLGIRLVGIVERLWLVCVAKGLAFKLMGDIAPTSPPMDDPSQ